MIEKELGAAMCKAFGRHLWKCFKLNNDEFQRGLPDYLLWGTGVPLMTLELKIAVNDSQALNKITPGQGSIIMSLQKTTHGTWLVFGASDATQGGVIWMAPNGKYTKNVFATGKDDLAEKLVEEIRTAVLQRRL